MSNFGIRLDETAGNILENGLGNRSQFARDMLDEGRADALFAIGEAFLRQSADQDWIESAEEYLNDPDLVVPLMNREPDDQRGFAFWAAAQALNHTGLDQREELISATRGVDGDLPEATKQAVRAVKADADRDESDHSPETLLAFRRYHAVTALEDAWRFNDPLDSAVRAGYSARYAFSDEPDHWRRISRARLGLT